MTKSERQVSFGQNDWRNMLITELRRTGGDPSILFEILESVIEGRAWEKLTDESGQPVGSLRRLIEAKPPVGSGQKLEKVLKLLEVEHRYERDNNQWHQRMTVLRDAIRKEIGEELPALNEHGTNQHREGVCNTNSSNETTDAEYITRRLKRDNPELAEAVINGELSAHRAAIQAGIRKERFTVPNHDMRLAARALTNKLSHDQVNELVGILLDWLEE